MRRIPDVIFGMMLAVAILAMGLTIGSQHQPSQTISAEKGSNESSNSRSDEGLWHWLTRDATGFFTAWVVIVGGFQLGLFIWQLRMIGQGTKVATIAATAARDSADNQFKDTRILQRAYLTVIPRGIDPFRSGEERLSCDVAFYNTGNLPARNVRWFINRKFSKNAYDNEFPIDETDFSGNNIVSPKTEMRKGGKAIRLADLNAFRPGGTEDDRWLYIWGRVTYTDGFGQPRFTDFCHRYNLIGTEGNKIDEKDARYHENGNRTDEEEPAPNGTSTSSSSPPSI